MASPSDSGHYQAILAQVQGHPARAALATELLCLANRSESLTAFLNSALPNLSAAAGTEYLGLAVAAEGRWNVEAETGSAQPLPEMLLADALDREQPRQKELWTAVPLAARESSSAVLLGRCKSAQYAPAALAALSALAPVLHNALLAVRRQAESQRRIQRLEAVLELSKQWNRTRELEPLFVHIAEAATRLLASDRASIFLWDRPNHVLVGRPALGVLGGELRIPDNRGVVGEVIQTGQPRRVAADSQPQSIDRHVDRQTGYRTKTLLCVPLRGASGELFGAFELINKRVGHFTAEDEAALSELAALAAIALENAQDRQQLLAANRSITDQAAERVRLIGNSPAIEALRSIVRRVANTDLAVLVLGENGTGKEVIAQAIHYWSHRRERPFVAVNCAAIPETLAESELFGHQKGAFTDAREARPGKFELAAGGTLFLDEIGDLSLACQAKLLRVLEEKVFVRVGGSTPMHSDARIVAATNQSLAEMVRQKRFREDLYFRLNVVTLDLPPLRQRPQDIMLLATHFLGEFCAKARRPAPQFTPAAQKRLEGHAWPGNVRELRNLMERLAYLSSSEQIEADELALVLSPRGQMQPQAACDQPLSHSTMRFQVDYIKQAIQAAGGNMSDAATRLGLHRSNLYRKMRQLGMDTPDFEE